MLADDVHQLGQAPVEHQRFTELTDHDVERLQVAMQHPFFVSKTDRLANGDELPQQSREGEIACGTVARQRVHGLDLFFQIVSSHQFHRIERSSVFLISDVINWHDSRMLKLAGDLSLFDKAFDNRLISERLRQQLFERHFAANRFVFRLPDVAQAAVREVVEQLITVGSARHPFAFG